jgi:hypothetical protein
MLLGGYAISLGFFAGLLSIFICSTLTICLFMERMKKSLSSGLSPLTSFKKTIKNTILQGIDIHFITILAGISFIFFGNLDLQIMGICLTIGSLLSVVFVLCLWPLVS